MRTNYIIYVHHVKQSRLISTSDSFTNSSEPIGTQQTPLNVASSDMPQLCSLLSVYMSTLRAEANCYAWLLVWA